MTNAIGFLFDGFEVVFEGAALTMFASHRQTRFHHREAGGQLFGHIERQIWHVTEATGPSTADRRFRFGFQPNRAREQREIYEFHARGLEYLGDWHTHPEDVPTASLTDLESISDIAQNSAHHLPGFLLCVVGRTTFPEGLWVSFHYKHGSSTQAHLQTS